MPPKVRFTKDDVRKAGLELVQKEGLQALTARQLAKALHASTAPVYSTYESMEKLRAAIMEDVIERLYDYTRREWTERRFLNMGTGIAVFAREESALYRALFLESNEFLPLLDQFHHRMAEDLVEDERFVDFNHVERYRLLMRMAVITYGLATMICVRMYEDDSLEGITSWLMKVGQAVIKDEVESMMAARKSSK